MRACCLFYILHTLGIHIYRVVGEIYGITIIVVVIVISSSDIAVS